MGSWVTLRPRQRERGPARLRRADLRRERPRRRQGVLGQRLPADRATRASSSAAAATRCCSSRNPDGVDAPLRRDSLDALSDLNGCARLDASATRRSRRASPPYETGLPDADERARADGHLRASRRRSHELYGARARARPRSPTTACSRAGWSSAACASCSSTTGAGTTTAPARRRHRREACRSSAAQTDQAAAALVHGPQAARAARRHARRLGRRVRPHADERGAQRLEVPRPRPPPARFTIWMAGGGVKPGITLRRDRRARLQRRRGPGPRPRPARDDAAPARARPHEADVPVPGPRLPPDRRPRQGRHRSCWRSRRTCPALSRSGRSGNGPYPRTVGRVPRTRRRCSRRLQVDAR